MNLMPLQAMQDAQAAAERAEEERLDQMNQRIALLQKVRQPSDIDLTLV